MTYIHLATENKNVIQHAFSTQKSLKKGDKQQLLTYFSSKTKFHFASNEKNFVLNEWKIRLKRIVKDVYPEKIVKYCILKYSTTSIWQNTYATRNRYIESFYSKNALYHFILLNPQPPTIKPQKRKYYLFFVSYTLILSSQHCFVISRSNSTLDRSVSISSLATMKREL